MSNCLFGFGVIFLNFGKFWHGFILCQGNECLSNSLKLAQNQRWRLFSYLWDIANWGMHKAFVFDDIYIYICMQSKHICEWREVLIWPFLGHHCLDAYAKTLKTILERVDCLTNTHTRYFWATNYNWKATSFVHKGWVKAPSMYLICSNNLTHN